MTSNEAIRDEISTRVWSGDLYDRARPSYHPSTLSHLREAVKASPPLSIVEIGAGTGIFTRALLAHPEWTSSVGQLKCFEPDESMRSTFLKTVEDPRVTIAWGTFDNTDAEDGWADIIIVAEAFHWCFDYEKASAEFGRILKPNGVISLVWYIEDRDSAPWVKQLRGRIDNPKQAALEMHWRATFSTPTYTALFNPPDERIWRYVLPSNRDLAIDRACSKSSVAAMNDADQADVVKDLETILDKGEGMMWMDQYNGIFEYPYVTLALLARKK